MGVRLRKVNGFYTAFINHNGKRTNKRLGKDAGKAKAVVAEMQDRLARADLRLPTSTDEPFAAYALRWIDGASIKASTKRFYRDNVRRYLSDLGNVASLNREDVKRLIVALRRKKLQPRTVTGIVRTLSTICSEAVEDGLLASNPALRPGRLKRRMADPDAPMKAPIDPYSREEGEALIATSAAKFPEWAAFVLTALRSGMRLGELRALQWDDIDWRGRFISVSRNYVEGAYTTPKSGRTRRVEMSPQLRQGLRLWRRRQAAAWLQQKQKRPRSPLVFPSRAGTPLDDAQIRKALRAIETAAEVRPRRSVVHVFRHTFCSQLLALGADPNYVKEQSGHASLYVLLTTYAHYLPKAKRGMVAGLDGNAPGVFEQGQSRMTAEAKG